LTKNKFNDGVERKDDVKEIVKLELSELIQKYKKQFIFKDEKMTLPESRELVSKLEKEPVSLDNDEMLFKLRSFISRQDYYQDIKNDQESKQKQAVQECDYYHNKLKELGTIVVQPGVNHNGLIDYLNVTYHLDGKVIYKWAAGIKTVDMAEQIKEIYEEITHENCSNL
jgi:hypothetical protein